MASNRCQDSNCRLRITANDKFTGCNECSRNCQVGIDIMGYPLKQGLLDNNNNSCIGCGICVTVCPMETLGCSEEEKTKGPAAAI